MPKCIGGHLHLRWAVGEDDPIGVDLIDRRDQDSGFVIDRRAFGQLIGLGRASRPKLCELVVAAVRGQILHLLTVQVIICCIRALPRLRESEVALAEASFWDRAIPTWAKVAVETEPAANPSQSDVCASEKTPRISLTRVHTATATSQLVSAMGAERNQCFHFPPKTN